MSSGPTIKCQLSILPETKICQTLVPNLPSKLLFGTDKITFDIRLRWIWKQYFQLHIWNDNHTKMIVLPLFQFATRLNSQNPYETEIHNDHRPLNCIRIPVSPICLFEVSTTRNWVFCFISFRYTITYLQTNETLQFITCGKELNGVKNVLFSSSKCEKWISAETYKSST
jgi:hypothetical protein